MLRTPRGPHRSVKLFLSLILIAACAAPAAVIVSTGADVPLPASMIAAQEQVLRGRALVINTGCGDCHGGGANPAADGWLAGWDGAPEAELPVGIPIGLCDPAGPQPCFRARPRNLTPDDTTGLGRFSERQIFNALRFGLRPSETPDVEITSAVPGRGNHPLRPNYLSPAMPWIAIRYNADEDLWAIAAYLKRGVRPVGHRVPDSEAPPDFWASEITVEKVGAHVPPAFPTAHEELRTPARREQVLRGRHLVITHGCALCHGGGHPGKDGWLAGLRSDQPRGDPHCTYCSEFPVGPFATRSRNLTPDNATGLGRFSERQIFNALRFGLRPGETPDVEITSSTPGEGNFPQNPKYLAPPMPWPVWRHMSDAELWAIAAYLKDGLRPVSNRVEDSEGPPDFWASGYTVEALGPYPARAFPTANERAP